MGSRKTFPKGYLQGPLLISALEPLDQRALQPLQLIIAPKPLDQRALQPIQQTNAATALETFRFSCCWTHPSEQLQLHAPGNTPSHATSGGAPLHAVSMQRIYHTLQPEEHTLKAFSGALQQISTFEPLQLIITLKHLELRTLKLPQLIIDAKPNFQGQTRPDQTGPDRTRLDQTRPDETRPD